MSSVDRNGRHFPTDSMDRFGDDLCQLIVGYLCDEDKPSLECVSKQWKRLIYHQASILKLRNRYFANSSKIFHVKGNDEDVTRLRALLTKWPNIRKVRLHKITISGALLTVINDNCHRLDALEISASSVSNQAMDVISGSLGEKIKHLYFFDMKLNNVKALVSLCPNVERLDCGDFSLFADTRPDFLPNLRSLKTIIKSNKYLLGFLEYSKQLNKLEIKVNLRRKMFKNFFSVFKRIDTLEEIKELKLELKSRNRSTAVLDIEEELRQIGLNCPHLKRLWITNSLISLWITIADNFWRGLKTFEGVVDLKLDLKTTHTYQSIADFGRKKSLKYLSIASNNIKEEMFANISEFVPNLHTFELETGMDLSDNLLDSLSGLRSLRELALNPLGRSMKSITDNGINRLLDNCHKLSKLDFENRYLPDFSMAVIARLVPIASISLRRKWTKLLKKTKK